MLHKIKIFDRFSIILQIFAQRSTPYLILSHYETSEVADRAELPELPEDEASEGRVNLLLKPERLLWRPDEGPRSQHGDHQRQAEKGLHDDVRVGLVPARDREKEHQGEVGQDSQGH